jgi:hypothetical protein
MQDFFFSLEMTPIGIFVRESPSLLAYPSVLFLHTLGLGLLVGTSVIVDLRLLGVGRTVPGRPLGSLFPVMWIGFWLNAISGTMLAIADASVRLINPLFYIKLALIAIAVAILMIIRRRVFRVSSFDFDRVPSNIQVMAGVSLFCWIAATTAGRLLAYVGPVGGMFF